MDSPPRPSTTANRPSRRWSLVGRYFYLSMALVIPAIVAYGFSFTVGMNLLHPAVPRPLVLYVHAAVFSGWLVFFALQAVLVRARHVPWHRLIGWFGAALGAGIVALGIATAIAMGRFNLAKLGSTRAETDLMVPLFDMLAFGGTFWLAVRWRARPEFHRRLMFVATCALTAAAFGRFPPWLLPPALFYAGVDALILLGVVRDVIVERKVHPVYRWVLPAFVAGQAIVTYLVVNEHPYARAVGHALLR